MELIKPRVKQGEKAEALDTLELSGKSTLRVFEANTFWSRLRGLHAFLPLAPDEALIIRPCNAIHTMSMSSVIDVVFVDGAGVVLKVESVPKYRFRRCAGACAVIEMLEGTAERVGIAVGDVLVRHYGVWK